MQFHFGVCAWPGHSPLERGAYGPPGDHSGTFLMTVLFFVLVYLMCLCKTKSHVDLKISMGIKHVV